MGLTFANLKAQVIELAHLDSTDQASMVGRWLNKRYEEWAAREQWSELEKTGHNGGFITTFAEYGTGTLDATEASTGFVGHDSLWLTAEILAGMKIQVDGFEEIYDIASDAAAEEALTLSSAYNGETVTEQGYRIFRDEYTLASDCREPLIFYRDDHPIEVQGLGIRAFRRASAGWRSSGGDPHIYTLGGLSSGDWILTIDPPDDNLLINYDYIMEITELSSDDDEPVMRNHMRPILVTGAMIDAMMWKGDKAGQDRYQVKYEYELKLAANRYLAGTQDYAQIMPALGGTRLGGRRITRRQFAALALAYDLDTHFGRLT